MPGVDAAVAVEISAGLIVASVVQSTTGFGFALLSMPLLALALDAKDAVALATVVGSLASVVLFARTRRHVRWQMVGRLLAGAVLGMPLGLVVLLAVPARVLQILIATVVLVFVVILARGWRLERADGRAEFAAGIISGVLNTSVSTNGPPIVLTLQARGLDPDEFRGTISAVFVCSSLVANALLASAGRYHGEVLSYALLGPPALLIGALGGRFLGRHLHAERFRPTVLGLLSVAAVSAGVSALLG
jgi:uncharacterized membrane protein YfcA